MIKRGLHNNASVARLFYALLLLLASVFSAQGQLSSRIYKTSILNDTLVAIGNRDFLYNTINITNLTGSKISVLVKVIPPEGWDMITQKLITISLDENGNTSLPIRLVPSKSKTWQWQTVKIEYRLNDGLETLTDTFRVRVKEFTKFKADLPLSNCVKMDYEKNIRFPIHLKNMGNTVNNYTVTFYNVFLNLNYKEDLQLLPGKDTTFFVPLHITEKQWASLKKEDIKVTVGVENGETMNMTQVVSKIGSLLKDNNSAFLAMPLQLETGATYQGKDNIQYYGALHGGVDISPNDRFGFDLRTKTLSKGQAVDNSIVRLEYAGLKWLATAGNINELTDFYMDGYGAKIARKWSDSAHVDLYGLLKSRTGNSNLGGINYTIAGVRKNLQINGGVSANFDNTRALNSYMLKQGAEYKFATNGKITISGGVGAEQSTAKLVSNTKNIQWGTSVGYNLQWNHKRFAVTSVSMFNSNSYPGFFKGQRMQSHDGRVIIGKTFIGGFYEFNLRKQNLYQDTALFSDVFNLKTENYGVRTGIGLNGINITLSAGNQFQVNSDTGANATYKFSYLNLNTSFLFFKKLNLNINSYYGQGILPGVDTSAVIVNSTQGSLQYKSFGAIFRYDNGPFYYHEYITYLNKPELYERTVISPFLDLNLFKSRLTVRSQYNYAKSLPTATENSNALANILYTNFKYGFDFNIIGIFPINDPSISPFLSASLRVRLVTPLVFVRKYYTLKMTLFKDANNNGLMDSDEEPISGQGLSVKGNIFVTDKTGTITFKNIEKGDYKTDFGKSGKIRGWIPSAGPVQSFVIKGNNTIYVPYKMSKVLGGKLTLEIDTNSNLTFSLSNIKVTAQTIGNSDTLYYSTLTDENGEFYFNLPEGKYNVTLSQGAFDDTFRPTEFTQTVDLMNNNNKTLRFSIRQRKRTINIKKK